MSRLLIKHTVCPTLLIHNKKILQRIEIRIFNSIRKQVYYRIAFYTYGLYVIS